MTKPFDTEYYSRRAAQERALAGRTTNPDAQRAHDELARLYAQMIAQPVATA